MDDDRSRLQAFLDQLRRRHVFRVAVVYAVVAWAVVEIADTAFPHLGLPGWTITLVVVLAMAGFPLAVVLAWAFEVTPEGVRRTGAGGEEVPGGAGEPAAPPWGPLGRYALAGILGVAVGVLALTTLSGGGLGGDGSWSSIAVLPFSDLSPEGEQAYLGEGIAEEITHALARVEGLRVAARTSAFRYGDGSADVREIGRDLGVEAVLEGSVRRDGETMRVTVQLADAEDGFHLFSETYDRTFDDVFRVQEEIARSVVGALGLELPGQGRVELVEAATDRPEAYDLYLRGRRAWQRITADGYREAIPYFERAIEADSTFARAYAGLADAYIFLGHWADAYPEDEWVARADSLLSRALELDPTLGEAYAARASMLNYRTDGRAWREAEALARTAAALSPRYAIAHVWTAWNRLEGHGDVEGALAAGARAYELDPVAYPVVRNYGRALLYAGQVDEALRILEEATPVLGQRHFHLLAHAYSAAGRHEEAERTARRWAKDAPRSWVRWLTLSAVTAAAGKRDVAGAALERAVELDPTPWPVGMVHGLMGEMDEAYRWLERGGWTLWDRARLELDPLYDPVRQDPRWDPLLERIKEELDVEG